MYYSKSKIWLYLFLIFHLACSTSGNKESTTSQGPNVIIIYADDLGFGDLSCYGMTNVATPHIDQLAEKGLKFNQAYATSATCTPSRFSLLTGTYAWRKEGTGIAPGNAGLIINPEQLTLADVFQQAGYQTGVVGKWHLGLGPSEGPDWNQEIRPGPADIGFDYSFLIPATGDRVPCVYTENGRVVDLDPNDPIQVSYGKPVGDEPTGQDHPELLKMKFHHGHDKTIINGISRIGYMTGGNAARWTDEDMADVITAKATDFIRKNAESPFFLYFASHDIHVPRVPHSRFVGKSGMGPRGDALVQLDWCTGEIMKTLDELQLLEQTLIVFSSDNGPVLNDGYYDQAVEQLNGHQPAGSLRGGKYSAFEAGTNVPMLVSWPGKIAPGESQALFSQVDMVASLAGLVGQPLDQAHLDSQDHLDVLLGIDRIGRPYLITQSVANVLSIIKDGWKYIEPSEAPAYNHLVEIELGHKPAAQLYDLSGDRGEKINLAGEYPEKVQELENLLKLIRSR
ncbi:MAG: sulfatase family protein [Candidatus Cyclobacteriaceae bacterium M3_2C_046]